MIVVVNKYKSIDPDIKTIYVGRPTPLGNPFRVGVDGDRDKCVELYEKSWDTWMRTYPPLKAQFDQLCEIAKEQDIQLVCFCAPKKCHADVLKAKIEEAINDYEKEKQ